MVTSKFTRIYPDIADGYITLDGGLNSNFPRSIIADNESPDCLNVIFDNGSVSTREGTTLLNNNSVGSFAGDGLYTRHANDGSETMCAWWGGTAYILEGATFVTLSSAQSIFTAGVRVASSEYENHIFFGNGGTLPYKYNGTDFTRHGIYPPTTTATVATNSAGTLTGEYLYGMTYVNTNLVESDIFTITATFTAASEDIALSDLPIAPQSYGVNTRKLYRTSAAGSVYYLLDTLNNNTQTAYTDNISDSALGVTAPTDQGVPPLYSAIDYTQDRFFMNDPGNTNFLWYTELANPYVVKATNFLRIGDNSGKNVSTIKAYNNGIVVGHKDGFEFIYMPDTDPNNWIRVVMRVPYGSKSQFGILPFQDRLIFPALQNGKFVGFGSIVGNSIEPNATFLTVLTAGGELISQKIEDQMMNVLNAGVGEISSIAFDNRIYIAVRYSTGSINNRIYVLDYNIDNLSKVQRFAWAPWSGLDAVQFTIYNNRLYYIDANDSGSVFQMNDGTYTDNGNAINSYYLTKEFSGYKEDVNYHKDHRFLNLLIENSGGWFIDVISRTDSDKGEGNKFSISVDPGSNLWGSLVWGRDNWGGGSDEKDYKLFLGSLRGKRIQHKFTNQNIAGQKFKIDRIKLAYNKKGYR